MQVRGRGALPGPSMQVLVLQETRASCQEMSLALQPSRVLEVAEHKEEETRVPEIVA